MLKGILLGITAVLLSFQVSAGGRAENVKIQAIKYMDHVAFISVSGTTTGKPTCAESTYYDFALYEGSTQVNAKLLMLVEAMNNGNTVILTGTGDCASARSDIDGDIYETTSERLHLVYVKAK